MSTTSKIEWTEKTWNPTTGCDQISPGCDNCYALTLAKRLKAMGQAKYQNDGDPRTSGPGFGLTVHPDSLNEPLRWRKPTTVFVNSMSDLFHARVPNDFLARVFAVMAATPQHTYQILTKRPERMARILNDEAFVGEVRRCYAQLKTKTQDLGVERLAPAPGFDGYLVSSHGHIYTTAGREDCAWCDKPLRAGIAKRKFCSQKCSSKADYEKRMGRWTAPEGMRRLKPDAAEKGHLRVMLYREGKGSRQLVHRLVLAAFDRAPVGDEQGRHLDSDPSNNHIDNLAWGSQADNWNERRMHGRHRSYSKLNATEVIAIRARADAGETAYGIAKDYPVSETQIRNIVSGQQWQESESEFPWPIPGVWLGTSIELDKYVSRADALRETPAAIRFISAEPLLGPLPSLGLTDIDWLILGGESGPGSRAIDPGWFRELIAMARDSGTAVFVKQMGTVWARSTPQVLVDGPFVSAIDDPVYAVDKKGGHWDFWPNDLKVREYPAITEAVAR